ncbi:MAG: hypothetical protein ACM3O4_02720 [Ignavibacteriales bacterium]
MKKKILMIILVIVLIKIVILSIITFSNKTFYKEYYEIKNSSGEMVKIPLPLFSYFNKEKKSIATFSTLKSVKKVQPILSKYVENLQSCYDEGYFYDKDLDITITRYQIEKDFPFNKIYLNYTKGNLCENEFVLDEDWMVDVISKAKIDSVNIDRCYVNNGIGYCDSKKINNAIQFLNYSFDRELKRVEINTNIGENSTVDHYVISGYYTLDGKGYTLMIFNYNDNLAFKVVDANDHSKNAIYDIDEDVNELFKDIYDNYTN